MTFIRVSLFLLPLIVTPQSLVAAERPDAGRIFRENAPPSLPLPTPEPSTLDMPATEGAPKVPAGPKIDVRAIDITGNHSIPGEELFENIPSLANIVGGQIDLAGLNALAAAISKYYRLHGYPVATAYVPEQDAKDGRLTIAVLEGKFDTTTVQGSYEKAGYEQERIRGFLDSNLCGGENCHGHLLESGGIDRALGIISDLPGLNGVSGGLKPGSQTGTSSFNLTANGGDRWVARLATDNYGGRYTGKWRGTTGFLLNNPLGIGDRANLEATTAGDGLNRGTFDYNLPIGYHGWRVGLDYSPSVYSLGAPFDAVDAHGQAHSLSPYITYPVLRHSKHNLFFRAAYSYKWLEDIILDTSTKKEEQTGTATLNGNLVDRFLGGGVSGASMTLTGGHLEYRDAPPSDQTTPEGDFGKLNYSLNRDHTLMNFGEHRLSLYASVVGQWAWENLDSVEKFSLGGPEGVRAYPVSEASGDIGTIAVIEIRQTFTLELPWAGKNALGFSLFRDQGWLTVNVDPWSGYSGPKERDLGGTGVGVSLSNGNLYAMKLMCAFRDHGGEEATSDKDADSRIWFQASMSF